MKLLHRFFSSEASGGVLLIIAAAAAMVLANLGITQELYHAFLETPVELKVGALEINKNMLLWINDALMAGFFTDFLGLLLLLPPVQKHLTMKLLPHLRFSRMPGGGFSTGPGDTFEGEYQRKDEQHDRLDHKDDR